MILKDLSVIILSWIIAVGTHILAMIYGWGLYPKSWWWIIAVGFGGAMFSKLLLVAFSHNGCQHETKAQSEEEQDGT